MRCFVGLPLPESYQQGLEEIAGTWKDRLASRISWTRKGNWHLTLAFLGELADDSVQLARQCLQSVSMESFPLKAEGGGFFPPGKSPRVIWVGVGQGRDACIRLADKIEQALDPVGYTGDKRPFHPHLTIGRVKQGRPDAWRALLKALQERDWPAFEAGSFVLWSSQLTPQGPSYSVIEEFGLSARPGSDEASAQLE